MYKLYWVWPLGDSVSIQISMPNLLSFTSLLYFETPLTKIKTSATTSLESTKLPFALTTSLIVRGHAQNKVLLSTVRVNVLAATEQCHVLDGNWISKVG